MLPFLSRQMLMRKESVTLFWITRKAFTKFSRNASLAALMIEHGVGVDHKAINIPRIDGDFFGEE